MMEFYDPLKDVWGHFRELISRRRARSARVKLRQAQKSFDDRNLHRFLAWKYAPHVGAGTLQRCEEPYSVAVFPAPKAQRRDLRSLTAQLDTGKHGKQTFITQDKGYRELITRDANRLLINRPVYAMDTLELNGKLHLNGMMGYYLDFLDTCQSLEWELLSKWAETSPKPRNESDFASFDKKLELRQRLHAQVDNPLRNGKGRCAALTVMTLIAFRDGSDYFLWIRPRSRRVAVYPSILHIIPSGTLQPSSVAVEDEWHEGGPQATLYREYLEELFDKPEPKAGQPDWRYIYGDARLRYLLGLLHDDLAELFLTGVAVNLLNLQPEICTLLVIKTPKWYEYHLKHRSEEMRFAFNEEWLTVRDDHLLGDFGRYVVRVPYSDSDHALLKAGKLTFNNVVPTGAAAFWIGIDVLRDEVLGTKH